MNNIFFLVRSKYRDKENIHYNLFREEEDFHEVRIHLLAGLSATHDGDDNYDDDTRRSVQCIKSYVPGSREGGSG